MGHRFGESPSSVRYLREDNNVPSTPVRRNGRKAITALCLLSLVLIVASSVSVVVLLNKEEEKGKQSGTAPTVVIKKACKNTMYQTLCEQSLMDFPGATSAVSVNDLVHVSFNMTLNRLNNALTMTTDLPVSEMEPLGQSAYDDCLELLEDSIESLTRSISMLSSADNGGKEDVMTWLSAALTNQDTCSEGLLEAGGVAMYTMKTKLANLSELISNCLAIFAATGNGDFSNVPIGSRRRLMENNEDGLPTWLRPTDRKLLQMPLSEIQADIIVAQDGNGTVTNITDALSMVPNGNPTRIVIYIKAGRYEEENLRIGRNKTNVMLIGDGKGLTQITGRKNIFDNITTFGTAVFAASGSGFIARDITFENWAGPEMHQAVALRVGADRAVVYQCNIIGYQDTLYTHSNRQFYRECDIYGTVDFIFGNAAVVFQNCSLYSRKPMAFQRNAVTAQNRKDPNQNTGISIHACRVLPAADLAASNETFETFLGRPWKPFARTVYMMSYIENHIVPRGWLEWNDTSPVDLLYYAEYLNYGPGSGVAQRVTWPGYQMNFTEFDAAKFTVDGFIEGSAWLPNTGVAFLAGLAV